MASKEGGAGNAGRHKRYVQAAQVYVPCCYVYKISAPARAAAVAAAADSGAAAASSASYLALPRLSLLLFLALSGAAEGVKRPTHSPKSTAFPERSSVTSPSLPYSFDLFPGKWGVFPALRTALKYYWLRTTAMGMTCYIRMSCIGSGFHRPYLSLPLPLAASVQTESTFLLSA